MNQTSSRSPDYTLAPDRLVLSERDGLVRLGRRAWAGVGIVALAVLYLALAALSGRVVPLVVAAVVAALFVPLVDRLSIRIPRKASAAIVLIGLLVIGVGAIAVAVAGIADQAPVIRQQLRAGLETVGDWLDEIGVDLASSADLVDGAEDLLGEAVPGLSSYVATIFSSAAAFLAGTSVGLFILFYLLADWQMFSTWVATHLGVPKDLGVGIVEDAVWSVRRYFYALTLTSLVTAVTIGLTAALLGVPLAFTIGLVTFITSYVPYVGAFVSGAFAVLIALGSGGITDVLIVLAVILVVQMVVHPLLQNRMTSAELDLHPVVSFGSTILGGALAGVLGATLSAPVVSMIIRIVDRVKHYGSREPSGSSHGRGEQPLETATS